MAHTLVKNGLTKEYQPSTGYRPSGSKASFGAAFLIHAGVIGALIMIPATVIYIQPENDIIEVYDIPLAPPESVPDETLPPPAEVPALEPQAEIDTPTPPVDRPVDARDYTVPAGEDTGIIDLGTDNGMLGDSGTGADFPVEALPDSVPAPVLVPPSINPRYADRMQPVYPSVLKRREVEGIVRVRVLIGADGHVKKIERLSATHDAFFRATERQSRKWRFNPATEDGKKIEAWYTVSLKFEMEP